MTRSSRRESACEVPYGVMLTFRSVGCKMVPNNEWPQAPLDVPIFGLKELEVSEYAPYISPRPHTDSLPANPSDTPTSPSPTATNNKPAGETSSVDSERATASCTTSNSSKIPKHDDVSRHSGSTLVSLVPLLVRWPMFDRRRRAGRACCGICSRMIMSRR